MTTQQNKKLTLGILLTFIICIGSAILAGYSTGPYGDYPNPGMHPGMIGPGSFNASGMADPQWEIPGDLRINANATVKGTLSIDKGLVIGSPTGGDMGTGTINIEKIYIDGSEMDSGDVHVDVYKSSISFDEPGGAWITVEQFNITLPAGGIITSLVLKAEMNPDSDGIQAQLKIPCLETAWSVSTGALMGFPERGPFYFYLDRWDKRVGVYTPTIYDQTNTPCTLFTRDFDDVITIDLQLRETKSTCGGCDNGIRNPELIVTYIIT